MAIGYKNFTSITGCEMRLPRIHQKYKQILYESDSGHLGDDFRAVWDELRILKQHCWCAFSIRYRQSFSDNSSFSTEYYFQEERFEQKIRDLANKLIGIQKSVHRMLRKWNFILKFLKAGPLYSGQFFFELRNPADLCLHLLY